jgi:type I restriction enzyme M protein
MTHGEIWAVAELLRGDFKQSEYGRVVLPFTVLRRLDCVLEKTKTKVLEEVAKKRAPAFLLRASGESFYNTSKLDLKKIVNAPDSVGANLRAYINAFSDNARTIFDHFDFFTVIDRLEKAKLLFKVAEIFSSFDLHPSVVKNADMGVIFEELIRKFSEISNETAGEHFTPREVIHLMVELLTYLDDDVLSKPGIVRTVYDPTAGTGGMLSVMEEHILEQNPKASITSFGQELNAESYAICKADLLIKGQDVDNIIFGNTLTEDGLPKKKFDYMLSNPPFGVEWKKYATIIQNEHKDEGFNGRFGPGLPRISDGSMLFLLHLISKMRRPEDGGSRIAIVLNGSPLFTGGAESGESEIRRYVLEHDLLEAIVALPTDMFYNTGISTYIWVLSNRKAKERRSKVQLINAVDFFEKMRKSLGSKRKQLSDGHISEIVRLYGDFRESPVSKIFPTEEFLYSTITVERPLRDEKGKPVMKKGYPVPDPALRDTENVLANDTIPAYFKREVLPHVPDAWIDDSKTKIGAEMPFTRYFYTFTPPRDLKAIDADLAKVTSEIQKMLKELEA